MAVATISVNFANAAEVAAGTETAKSINPAALNLALRGGTFGDANVAALTSRDTIVAPFFKGSGRLLTDLFTLTGGPITLTVGSSGKYANLSSAFQGISALILDQTAQVTFQLAGETILEPNFVDISRTDGDKISIVGTSQIFSSSAADTFCSCVSSVAPTLSSSRTFTMSATFALSPASNIPAIGDYLHIYAVSGRDAFFWTDAMHTNQDGEPMTRWDSITNTSIYALSASLFYWRRFMQPGTKVLMTVFSGSTTISKIRTIHRFDRKNDTNCSDTRPVIVFAESPASDSYSTYFANQGGRTSSVYGYPISIVVGTPDSYRNTTLSQTGNIITFADGVATNTWLNPGDIIYTLGQARLVTQVFNNSHCRIDSPFRTGAASSYTTSGITGVPFLVKTQFEKYRGCHRVVESFSNGGINFVTIEIGNGANTPNDPIWNPGGGATPYSSDVVSFFPLPKHGVRRIGFSSDKPGLRPLTEVGAGNPLLSAYTPKNYPESKILKTKLTFSGSNGLVLNGATIKGMQDIVIHQQIGATNVNNYSNGFLIGLSNDLLRSSTSGIVFNSGIAFTGAWSTAIQIKASSSLTVLSGMAISLVQGINGCIGDSLNFTGNYISVNGTAINQVLPIGTSSSGIPFEIGNASFSVYGFPSHDTRLIGPHLDII